MTRCDLNDSKWLKNGLGQLNDGLGRLKDGLSRPKDGLMVVLVSTLTLYSPSATDLFHFVLKLIFSENEKTLKNT